MVREFCGHPDKICGGSSVTQEIRYVRPNVIGMITVVEAILQRPTRTGC